MPLAHHLEAPVDGKRGLARGRPFPRAANPLLRGHALHPEPFPKLPIRFDAPALEAEVRASQPPPRVPHPTGFPGNEAVRLVTVGGRPTDDFDGPMRPTESPADAPTSRR